MRALVVEDEPDVADDIRAGLQAVGFVVAIAPDGRDAWFSGDVEDYDIAILDLGLPHLDGLSVLKRWRAADRSRSSSSPRAATGSNGWKGSTPAPTIIWPSRSKWAS